MRLKRLSLFAYALVAQVALVSQEPILYARSVRRNSEWQAVPDTRSEWQAVPDASSEWQAVPGAGSEWQAVSARLRAGKRPGPALDSHAPLNQPLTHALLN